MHITDRYENVLRALVYKLHERFTSLESTGTKSNVIGQPKLVTEEMIIKVKDCLLPLIEETVSGPAVRIHRCIHESDSHI